MCSSPPWNSRLAPQLRMRRYYQSLHQHSGEYCTVKFNFVWTPRLLASGGDVWLMLLLLPTRSFYLWRPAKLSSTKSDRTTWKWSTGGSSTLLLGSLPDGYAQSIQMIYQPFRLAWWVSASRPCVQGTRGPRHECGGPLDLTWLTNVRKKLANNLFSRLHFMCWKKCKSSGGQ